MARFSLLRTTLLCCCCGAAAVGASSLTYPNQTVASTFKAPNADSFESVAQLWKQQDEALWEYVSSNVPNVLEHTGSSAFDEHLKGVQAVLRGWNAPHHLPKAGLFHSIYGTEGFQGFSLPLSERKTIQKLIGVEAEKLCFIFCMVDRSSVDKTVFAWNDLVVSDEETRYTFKARPELGRFDIELSKQEWLDFIELTLVDWLEQVEGAAMKASPLFLWKVGEAYAYRRDAYRKMSNVLAVERAPRLSQVAPRMLEQVMSTESQETRHLVQPRTPPVSEAAAAALHALRAIGEDIPIDLSPQPMNGECTMS
jgi:hypothetical protein